MSKLWLAFCAAPLALFAQSDTEISVIAEKPTEAVAPAKDTTPKVYMLDSSYKAFTGRINGNNVRMRTGADLDSCVVKELSKDELVVVMGQKGDFYAVQPLADQHAYIFRSFILDGVVEGNRVNVRLHPDLEAPIVAHLSSGAKVEGAICKNNHKWLEIDAPADTRFFIAKEYVDYAGGPDLKAIHDKRCATVNQLLDSANLLTQAEMRKTYSDIDLGRITHGYQTIIQDYVDFPAHCEKASKALAKVQEEYLQKKIAYLEARAEGIEITGDVTLTTDVQDKLNVHTDRMKMWEPLEEALYLTWSGMHHAKTMDDFYAAQKINAVKISGIVEAYTDPVKCKPGDYILRQDGVLSAYLYSTTVNLQALVGKKVTMMASARPNNSFAFPAYYVIEAE
ncbi:MAG: SH3 domain-containing protein [Chlamydiia bacterium]|nr:SH3 domain-containing protein [Chlamydiia bacterium]MCP5510038.1 SH3 domain-containing protein [Chlamydiales bacterium]HPE84887.1 SH3 domain-containing protein [Chlamydiales bacterium]